MASYYENEGRALSWDDEIQEESSFVLLEPGEYDFTVTQLDREWFDGSEKMPACNRAKLHLLFKTPAGDTTIQHSILLHTKTEWSISAFWASVGKKEKGQRIKPDWNAVVGLKGRATVTQTDYKGKTYNNVDKFIPAYDVPAKTYKAGEF